MPTQRSIAQATLRSGTRVVPVTLSREASLREPAVFRDKGSALAYLRPFAHDTANIRTFRTLLSGVVTPGLVARWTDAEVLEAFANRLVSRMFVLHAPLKVREAFDLAREEVDDSEGTFASTTAHDGGPTTDSWLEIELIDDAGNPVPNEPYRVEFDDGTDPIRAKLNDKGKAKHEGIKSWHARVIFPDREEIWWRPTLEPRLERPEPAALSPGIPDALTLRIELVDDTGHPVPDEIFRVESHDGRVLRRGQLDEEGLAEVSGVEPNSRVVFPDREEAWWHPAAEPLRGQARPEPRRPSPGIPVAHWIEIAIQDDFGRPVPFETYRIESPDGRVLRTGQLDDQGFARVEGVEKKCRVVFPDREESWWRATSG